MGSVSALGWLDSLADAGYFIEKLVGAFWFLWICVSFLIEKAFLLLKVYDFIPEFIHNVIAVEDFAYFVLDWIQVIDLCVIRVAALQDVAVDPFLQLAYVIAGVALRLRKYHLGPGWRFKLHLRLRHTVRRGVLFFYIFFFYDIERKLCAISFQLFPFPSEISRLRFIDHFAFDFGQRRFGISLRFQLSHAKQ